MHPIGQIKVHHEWGMLKEALLGYPYFSIPIYPETMADYVPRENLALFEQCVGGTVETKLPRLWEKQVAQLGTAAKILTDLGVKVHHLPPPTEEEIQYLGNYGQYWQTLQYARDAIVVIGNNYIETGLRWPGRRMERWANRRVLGDRLQGNARVVSMPEPPMVSVDQGDGPGPFLEGGDVLLLGRDILVGNTGNASNRAGIDWLQQYLGSDYRVHEVKLSRAFLHLDCCFAACRPGLALICKEAFVDGIPEPIRDWQFIEVSKHDAEAKLACNGLVIDEKTMLIARGVPHLAKALRAAGQEVIETPFDALTWQGGGFRCWHHPLVRESEL